MLSPVSLRRFEAHAADYAALQAITASFPSVFLCDYEFDRQDDLAEFVQSFAAYQVPLQIYLAEAANGEAVGYGFWFRIPWIDGDESYWVALRVRADRRRQGVGSQLWQQIRQDLQQRQARSLRAMTRENDPDSVTFAAQAGFQELLRSRPFTLDVRGIDLATFPDLREPLAAQGLRLTTLADLQPLETWLPRIYALHCELVRDVPLPTYPLMTQDSFARFATVLPNGYFVVLDGDQPVGESFVHPSASDPLILNQQVTGVLGSYRGHKLALALKLLTIDYAQQHGFATICTWVESNNAPMLAINRRLNFVEGAGTILFSQSMAQ